MPNRQSPLPSVHTRVRRRRRARGGGGIGIMKRPPVSQLGESFPLPNSLPLSVGGLNLSAPHLQGSFLRRRVQNNFPQGKLCAQLDVMNPTKRLNGSSPGKHGSDCRQPCDGCRIDGPLDGRGSPPCLLTSAPFLLPPPPTSSTSMSISRCLMALQRFHSSSGR